MFIPTRQSYGRGLVLWCFPVLQLRSERSAWPTLYFEQDFSYFSFVKNNADFVLLDIFCFVISVNNG